MRRFELEDVVNRPGTYFNPETEMLVVVDDSPAVDRAAFDGEQIESGEWVLVSDDIPLDEDRRDELIERFQARRSVPGGAGTDDEPDELDGDEFEGFDVSGPDEG